MKTANDWAVSIMNNSGGNYLSISKTIQQAQAEAFAAGLEAAVKAFGPTPMVHDGVIMLSQVQAVIRAIPNPYKQGEK